MKYHQKKMTRAERATMEAEVAALRLKAKKLNAALKADDEATEAPVEEVAEAVAAEVAEEVSIEETPDEAPAEEVTDEEALVEAEAEEAPDEEAPVEAEAEEESDEEAPDEAPAEAVVEAPVEEAKATETPAKEKKSVMDYALRVLAVGVGVLCLAGIITLMMMFSRYQTPDDGPGGSSDITGPGTTEQPVVESFDMDGFKNSVVSIATQFTADENIATNADIFVEKIGADKLEELIEKYGELSVQKAIAEFLAFTPEIKMMQYVANNGLDYNPNAADEYSQMLIAANEAYTAETGKNPNGALLSLEGYDTYKSNREAIKALITETGDTALLTWYEAKTSGYDLMMQQTRDTEAAEAYKEEVKLEIVTNSNGSAKLIEFQLEQGVTGTNPDTLQYTEEYRTFIINNYIYVVAN